MAMKDVDVAIVGAGAAGIAAARLIAETSRSFLLIEASNRLGGRAWTFDWGGDAIDLGCGWLHSADRNPWSDIAGREGFTLDRSTSAWRRQYRNLGFSEEEREEMEASFERFGQRLHSNPPPSDRASDAIPQDEPWAAWLNAISGYMNGVPLDRLSVSDFLSYDDAATEANWRVREGYGRLIGAHAPCTGIALAAPVTAIDHNGKRIRIDTMRGTVKALAAIVTVPTNVLGEIRFAPVIDTWLEAAARLPLGLANKLFLRVDPAAGLEAESHLIGNPRNALTGSYYIRPFGTDLIECFFGGTGARALEAEGLRGMIDFAEDELAALLGGGIRRRLKPLIGTSWGQARFVQGSYSHALPGHADARRRLAEPIDQRLFFAGEATHPTDFSTAHGAYESGITAAKQAIAALGGA